MNFYHSKLNAIKIALGLDVKMVDAILKDGVTKVSAESLEPGSKIYVVDSEGNKAPAPEGTHELEDGTEVYVDAMGTITEVELPEVEAEITEEVEAAEVPEGEKSAEQPTKSEDEVVKEEEVSAKENEVIEEAMKKMVMAIEEIAAEVGAMKEEMASYKSKMEKMSKTPAASKIKTYNEEVSTSSNAIEDRLEALKNLRSEITNKKPKY
jgi:hypothetical protein